MKETNSLPRRKLIITPLRFETETRPNLKTAWEDPQELDPPERNTDQNHQPLIMSPSEPTVAKRGATVSIGDTPTIEKPELLPNQHQSLKKG